MISLYGGMTKTRQALVLPVPAALYNVLLLYNRTTPLNRKQWVQYCLYRCAPEPSRSFSERHFSASSNFLRACALSYFSNKYAYVNCALDNVKFQRNRTVPCITDQKSKYKMIKEYIESKYGVKVHTAYTAEVKEIWGCLCMMFLMRQKN